MAISQKSSRWFFSSSLRDVTVEFSCWSGLFHLGHPAGNTASCVSVHGVGSHAAGCLCPDGCCVTLGRRHAWTTWRLRRSRRKQKDEILPNDGSHVVSSFNLGRQQSMHYLFLNTWHLKQIKSECGIFINDHFYKQSAPGGRLKGLTFSWAQR